MKEPRQTSPFAALTLKEQQEKWIAWQSQQLESRPLPQAKEKAESSPQTRGADAAKTAPSPLPPPRHSQYDAVLRRISEASKRAAGWQQVT